MAENKKSFVAYSDWYGIFKALPDEVAGKLIKHIFSYVNDENPTTDDYVINALFEPIKNALKRDLIKWENERQQRSDAGKKSAKLRSQRNLTSVETRSTNLNETERNSTDNVNVNVNVNDNVNNIKFNFKKSLLDLGVDLKIVNSWLDVRKIKKAVNSEIAFDAIKKEIEQSNMTANECIKISVENSWSGFKVKWLSNDKKEPEKTVLGYL